MPSKVCHPALHLATDPACGLPPVHSHVVDQTPLVLEGLETLGAGDQPFL